MSTNGGPLPEGWFSRYSRSLGRECYYNLHSSKTTCEFPTRPAKYYRETLPPAAPNKRIRVHIYRPSHERAKYTKRARAEAKQAKLLAKQAQAKEEQDKLDNQVAKAKEALAKRATAKLTQAEQPQADLQINMSNQTKANDKVEMKSSTCPSASKADLDEGKSHNEEEPKDAASIFLDGGLSSMDYLLADPTLPSV